MLSILAKKGGWLQNLNRSSSHLQFWFFCTDSENTSFFLLIIKISKYRTLFVKTERKFREFISSSAVKSWKIGHKTFEFARQWHFKKRHALQARTELKLFDQKNDSKINIKSVILNVLKIFSQKEKNYFFWKRPKSSPCT